eukprot:TRINITY_DN17853_c0_g1_i1.p1 TRINITY_DN17853_c0_g1~~TRINITY_DN17853_c0_g1_i1.p1  ORF type:complete len:115 (+),score=16.34 TRINITY_DN17853_c0_g1_i1:65-409(+)
MVSGPRTCTASIRSHDCCKLVHFEDILQGGTGRVPIELVECFLRSYDGFTKNAGSKEVTKFMRSAKKRVNLGSVKSDEMTKLAKTLAMHLRFLVIEELSQPMYTTFVALTAVLD